MSVGVESFAVNSTLQNFESWLKAVAAARRKDSAVVYTAFRVVPGGNCPRRIRQKELPWTGNTGLTIAATFIS
jgi:hypothetical protein